MQARVHRYFGAGWVAVILLLCVTAAAAPSDVCIQGTLTNSQGALYGNRVWRVQYYDAATGGNSLGAAITGTTLVDHDGRWTITLTPPSEALNAMGAVWYELGIDSSPAPDGAVNTKDVFSDRVKVESVLFAQRAVRTGGADTATTASAALTFGGLASGAYVTTATLATGLVGKSDTGHTHDGRYYTESEMDAMLADKSVTSHTHSLQDLGGAVTDGQVPDNITVNHAGTAGAADTADYATTATIAGNALALGGLAPFDYATTGALTSSLATKSDTSHSHDLQDLGGAVTDGQVPDTITISSGGSVDAGALQSGTVPSARLSLADSDVPNALTLSGGTVNDTPVGALTPSTGAFTTLESQTLDTGQGANDLYAMNQDVRTSDDVTFNEVTATTATFGTNSVTIDDDILVGSGGKVGIGTGSPSEALEVQGVVKVNDTTDPPATTTDRLYNNGGNLYWNGTQLDAAGAQGDFKADGSVAMTGNLNLGGNGISNLGTDLANDDVADDLTVSSAGSVDAAALKSGTVPSARLSLSDSDVPDDVTISSSGSVDAAALKSGTVPSARLSLADSDVPDAITVSSSGSVDAAALKSGTVPSARLSLADSDVPDAITISGGTVNNTPIGASTASTGVFTTLAANTLDTGQGANELYDMNQNVQTTDAVTFSTVDTGQGANELHAMDQNVRTTDDVTFASVATTADMTIASGGKVGIGTASPAGLLHVQAPAGGSIATGGTASWTTGYYQPASNAFDGNDSTYAESYVQNAGLRYDLGSGVSARVTSYRVAGSHPYRTTDWRLEGSNDASSWDVLDSQAGQDTSSGPTYSVASPGVYRYYQLVGTASMNSGTRVTVGELGLYVDPGQVVVDSSGHVGIGTASPSAALDVNGVIMVQDTTNAPATTTDRLYNNGGKLFWGATPTVDGDGNSFVSIRTVDLGGSATINDLALGDGTFFILSNVNGAGSTITGIAGGVDGRVVHLYCNSANSLTLAHENAGSTAANRAICENGDDDLFLKYGALSLVYVGSSSRWVILNY